MKIEELVKEIKQLKINIWNNNKELLIEEYKKYDTKQFISLLNLITKDIDKLLNKLYFSIEIDMEVMKRQKEKAKTIKEIFA